MELKLQRWCYKGKPLATVFAKDAIVKGATKAVLNTLNEFQKNGVAMSKKEKANYIIDMMNTLCTSTGIHKIIS